MTVVSAKIAIGDKPENFLRKRAIAQNAGIFLVALTKQIIASTIAAYLWRALVLSAGEPPRNSIAIPAR